MLLQKELKKKNKRELLFLVLRLHFLVFLLIGVVWSRSQLKKKSLKPTEPKTLERKARILPLDSEGTLSD